MTAATLHFYSSQKTIFNSMLSSTPQCQHSLFSLSFSLSLYLSLLSIYLSLTLSSLFLKFQYIYGISFFLQAISNQFSQSLPLSLSLSITHTHFVVLTHTLSHTLSHSLCRRSPQVSFVDGQSFQPKIS
jgi:hypothetical protein